jgi:glycerol uptake facilitator-like aquaporin
MKVNWPTLMRQFGAEVLGTLLLVLFGDAAIAQVQNLHILLSSSVMARPMKQPGFLHSQ